jgi:hypothetical protein
MKSTALTSTKVEILIVNVSIRNLKASTLPSTKSSSSRIA